MELKDLYFETNLKKIIYANMASTLQFENT